MKTSSSLQRLIIVAAVTVSAATSAAGAPPDPPDMKDVPLTLSGCVTAGEAKNSFLLTNVVLDGTTAAPTNAFYRLNKTDRLKEHVGRRVEIKGTADLDDVDMGRVRMDKRGGKATTEITAKRRTVKVNEDVFFGSIGALKVSADVPTYKFDVESVKLLEGNCAGSGAAR
jgi:hypothetical protein